MQHTHTHTLKQTGTQWCRLGTNKADGIHPPVCHLNTTYLLPDRLSGHQLRFNGDEECDERSLAQAPQRIITTISAVAALLAVAQQHCRCVHLECSINLSDSVKKIE